MNRTSPFSNRLLDSALGTSLWLTPNGNLIKQQGITPDVPVALPPGATPLRPSEVRGLTPEALRNSQDRPLLRALDEVTARTSGQ